MAYLIQAKGKTTYCQKYTEARVIAYELREKYNCNVRIYRDNELAPIATLPKQ
jgi:hypothetical protein